jgi:hypothetical protein
MLTGPGRLNSVCRRPTYALIWYARHGIVHGSKQSDRRFDLISCPRFGRTVQRSARCRRRAEAIAREWHPTPNGGCWRSGIPPRTGPSIRPSCPCEVGSRRSAAWPGSPRPWRRSGIPPRTARSHPTAMVALSFRAHVASAAVPAEPRGRRLPAMPPAAETRGQPRAYESAAARPWCVKPYEVSVAMVGSPRCARARPTTPSRAGSRTPLGPSRSPACTPRPRSGCWGRTAGPPRGRRGARRRR